MVNDNYLSIVNKRRRRLNYANFELHLNGFDFFWSTFEEGWLLPLGVILKHKGGR